jgi:polyvinyl alcohol dehydrogenase (cytochrome)
MSRRLGARHLASAPLFVMVLLLSACGESGRSNTPVASAPATVEWATYGQNQMRTFFNANETKITAANVGSLRIKWRYLTDAIVSASPSVAYIDVPGETREKIVFVVSWDGNLYSLRASNGSRLWNAQLKPQPGAPYPYASSAAVATVAGEQRVYVGGGMTMYCFAAATGEERWEFDAGTGCTTCDANTELELNEIESSPAVVDNLVYFGMDVNSAVPAKGGAYAVDATDGHLVWYFDIDSGSTCRPESSDNVRHFDGYHSVSELRLADEFFSTRPGCNFVRHAKPCAGEMWSSFAVDDRRRMLYAGTSNCDDTSTMPPYNEAVLALTFDGVPKWVWRPRQTDTGDLDFGATPNLFTAEIGGVNRDVVGAGSKDGTYYLLDRDGVNKTTGQIEPYWRMQVVPGGDEGGIIGSAAVNGSNIFFHTAIGLDISKIQTPTSWALHASDGAVAWSNTVVSASFGPTTAIPGVVFGGDIFLKFAAQDATSGHSLGLWAMGGPESSGATVVDGEVFVGDGTGSHESGPGDQAYAESLVQSYVTTFCLPDASDCPSQSCDDGNRCTYDFYDNNTCQHEPYRDGLGCTANGQSSTCRSGECAAPPVSPSAAIHAVKHARPF